MVSRLESFPEGVIQRGWFEKEVRVFDPKASRWEVYSFTCQLNDMYVEEACHFVECMRGSATSQMRWLGWSSDHEGDRSDPPRLNRAAVGVGLMA